MHRYSTKSLAEDAARKILGNNFDLDCDHCQRVIAIIQATIDAALADD